MLFLFHFSDDFFEYVGVEFSQFRKHFSVDYNFLFVELAREFGVRGAERTYCRVDFDLPEGAEFALLFSAVRECVLSRMKERFARQAFFGASAMAKPTRSFEYFSPSFYSDSTSLYSSHD